MKIDNTFNTPILLLTFNRPTHTRRVFEELKKKKPKYIYAFQDGARMGNEADQEKCSAVREIIAESLNWDCEMKTYYSDVNLGCGKGPATGITWFFEQVDQGIIFEDDCIPSETLFRFYEELLNTYKDDSRISLITASNLKLKWKSNEKSYVFSTVGAATMGSWAGWARAWKMFEYDILAWKDETERKKIAQNLRRKKYYEYYSNVFDLVCDTKQIDAWDYQWFFNRTLYNTISIVSTVNQISNIGFGIESTHTPDANNRIANLPVFNIKFPLIHSKIKIDKLFDWVIFSRYYYPKKKNILIRFVLKIVEKIYCK